jgi:hypothetical protein
MDADKVPTLAKNFPDVLLALLKRMNSDERSRVLSEFENSHPEAFAAWHNPEVQEYLRSLR